MCACVCYLVAARCSLKRFEPVFFLFVLCVIAVFFSGIYGYDFYSSSH